MPCRRKKRWDGPLQYEDKSGQLMMLPADMALVWDKKFKKYVDLYAKDEEAFFKVGCVRDTQRVQAFRGVRWAGTVSTVLGVGWGKARTRMPSSRWGAGG